MIVADTLANVQAAFSPNGNPLVALQFSTVADGQAGAITPTPRGLVLTLSAGALNAGAIVVTGAVSLPGGGAVTAAQNVRVSLASASSSTAAVTTGTAIDGGGTDEVWLQTTAAGGFVLSVVDPTPGELCLLVASGPNNAVNNIALQF
jgi:hypothetical protein